jgi:phage tail sheath gpL-like
VGIELGVGVRSVVGARSLLLLGNMITAPITRTVGATTYTTAAGTATVGQRTDVSSPEDADAKFGAGSALALMARAAFAQSKRASIYAVPVAEGVGAVKATATLLFAGTVTAAGVVRVVVAGRRTAEVPVAAAATAASVATEVAHAINRLTNAPFTATVSSATVTLAAKQGGPRGNNLCIRCEYTATGGTVALNGGPAGTLVTGRFGTGTATAGSVTDDITAALAAVASGQYFIAVEADDDTNLAALRTHINTYVAITERKRQQGVAAVTALSVANAIARAQGLNSARIQVAYYRDASSGGTVDPMAPCTGELAAQVAAGRLYGDGAVGGGVGRVKGELAYPAANLNGLMLASVPAQELQAAQLLGTEVEQLLQGGVSPVVPSARNPGMCEVVRCVTTYSLDASNAPTFAVKSTSKVTVADYTAQAVEARIAAEFPNKNLAPEPENPAQAPTHEDIIYPSMVRSSILTELFALERAGLLSNVEANADAVIVEVSSSNPELLLASIPADVVDHFNSAAMRLAQVG